MGWDVMLTPAPSIGRLKVARPTPTKQRGQASKALHKALKDNYSLLLRRMHVISRIVDEASSQ